VCALIYRCTYFDGKLGKPYDKTVDYSANFCQASSVFLYLLCRSAASFHFSCQRVLFR
jgi:hypothetical protein